MKITVKPLHGSSREYWVKYYQTRFNKTGLETSAHMAMWYHLLILSE